jgi:hypothetical protein
MCDTLVIFKKKNAQSKQSPNGRIWSPCAARSILKRDFWSVFLKQTRIKAFQVNRPHLEIDF